MIAYSLQFTLIRLIASFFLPLVAVSVLPLGNLWYSSGLAILFGFLCLTDYLDGFFARKYQQETVVGKVLDPIADKLLVFSGLVTLLLLGHIHYIWVMVLVGRDFLVSGLRIIALEYGNGLTVSWIAKFKTALLMGYVFCAMLQPYLTTFEVWLFWISVALSLGSAALYVKEVFGMVNAGRDDSHQELLEDDEISH